MVAPCAATDTVTGLQPVALQTTGFPRAFPPDQTSSTSYVPAARATSSERLVPLDLGFSVSIFSMQAESQVTDLVTLKLLRNSIANAPPLMGLPKTIVACFIFETGFSAVTHIPVANDAQQPNVGPRKSSAVWLMLPDQDKHLLLTVWDAKAKGINSVDSPPFPLVSCCVDLSNFQVCSGVMGLAHFLS